MRTRRFLFPLGFALLALTLGSSRADGPDWFDFVLPWDDAGPHGAQPDETDVHSFTSQQAGCWLIFAKRERVMMTKKPAEG